MIVYHIIYIYIYIYMVTLPQRSTCFEFFTGIRFLLSRPHLTGIGVALFSCQSKQGLEDLRNGLKSTHLSCESSMIISKTQVLSSFGAPAIFS